MIVVTVREEPIHSSGALSVFHAAVDELERRYGQSDDVHHLHNDELAPPRGAFLVARIDGHLAGGVGLRSIVDPALGVGEVKRLWVRPDLRRAGVAAQLMDAVQDHARSLGYQQLYLETGHAQPEALAFYPATGWSPVDSFPPGAFTHERATRFTKVL
ncbi:MAG TPA: GNAT family N-acetyltransferase [Acidimicrobiales bacterium]|nr:GNAT family N-acetyltransferase [Acidimicrobiales bacterium]